MIDDAEIRAIVERLARPAKSGGHTIERAAILAEGANCGEIEAWIVRNGGEPFVNRALIHDAVAYSASHPAAACTPIASTRAPHRQAQRRRATCCPRSRSASDPGAHAHHVRRGNLREVSPVRSTSIGD